jgi:hypothetical protein
MTKLTSRQMLLAQISNLFDDALQSDLENGVKSLNEKAAESFKQNYPALNDAIRWIYDLYMEEMPDD